MNALIFIKMAAIAGTTTRDCLVAADHAMESDSQMPRVGTPV